VTHLRWAEGLAGVHGSAWRVGLAEIDLSSEATPEQSQETGQGGGMRAVSASRTLMELKALEKLRSE
jgi:hypothetical protein